MKTDLRSKALVSSDEPLVERIAEEILDRQRAGERPTVEEYCRQYPEHADGILSLPSRRETCQGPASRVGKKNEKTGSASREDFPAARAGADACR